jgi:hypothetical protein
MELIEKYKPKEIISTINSENLPLDLEIKMNEFEIISIKDQEEDLTQL